MVDTTNPASGVDSGSDEAAVSALMQRFSADEPKQPQEAQPPKVEEPPADPAAQSEELTADDIPDPPELADAQSAVEAFEIVHNGQQRKLSREETIKLAQQGFDYTQKTQALAEKQRLVDAALQRAQDIEQMVPQVAQELAQVKAFEGQLEQWKNVDWVQLATADPLEYPKYRAQYDVLVQGYQRAVAQFQQKHQAISQQRNQLTAQRVQSELTKLQEAIPEFRDGTKFQKAAGDISRYLQDLGVPKEYVDNIGDALQIQVAYKAMLYDRLAKAKQEKVKQLRTAPPVTRPNASQAPDAANADRSRDAVGRFKKSGETKDAVQVLLNRWRSN